ncbi:helix-turn-helix domain-containing protein [Maridesulfovibrio sp.]
MSQAEFAKTLGVSRNTLIRYEKNETDRQQGS